MVRMPIFAHIFLAITHPFFGQLGKWAWPIGKMGVATVWAHKDMDPKTQLKSQPTVLGVPFGSTVISKSHF